MMSTTLRHARVLRWSCVALIAGLFGAPAWAFEPSLPDAASATFDDRDALGSVAVPIAPYGADDPTVVVEGPLRRRAWLIPSPTLPTLRIVQDLREEITAAGYEIVLDCAGEDCGGFDFRFDLPVLAAPAMNVDLFDFRVLTATKSFGPQTEYLYVLVSKGRSNRYIQLFEVVENGAASPRGEGAAQASDATTPAPSTPISSNVFVSRLVDSGHVVLSDLEFATGADALSERDYSSLSALADYLIQNPASRLALVGHTDAVGSLDANIALSQRRAESVRQRLIRAYDIPETQITARGAGYLAPVQSNLTAQGRTANRRVEAILLSIE
ncbi:OmpA family protein [Pseudooceanicola sp. MF1-13]|uniref:OmpA family protein n=1 Tax=Pseudooceanicola sp. MF1-13 TaxID=3379095 RepID=UPI00389131DD